MPEEIFETPQPTQTTEPKPTNWTKIILIAVLGLGLLVGAACAGYWYGAESSKIKTQNQEEPTHEPTATPIPSVKFTYEPPLPYEAEFLSIKKVSDYRGDLIQAQYKISTERDEDYYHQFFRDGLNENGWIGIAEGVSTVWDMGAIKGSVELRVTVDYKNAKIIIEEFL